jgi:hypothetical protein
MRRGGAVIYKSVAARSALFSALPLDCDLGLERGNSLLQSSDLVAKG